MKILQGGEEIKTYTSEKKKGYLHDFIKPGDVFGYRFDNEELIIYILGENYSAFDLMNNCYDELSNEKISFREGEDYYFEEDDSHCKYYFYDQTQVSFNIPDPLKPGE